MSNNYLSAAEKDQLLKLAALTVAVNETIEAWAKTGKRKILVKWLRTAATYIEKAYAARLKELDLKEIRQLTRQAQTKEIVFLSNLEAKRARAKLLEEAGTQVMPWNDFQVLAAHALASCSICESGGDDVKECPFRSVLMDQDIEALTLEPDPGACQYRAKAVPNG